MTFIIIIFISYILNACADSIDHSKGSQDLFELWHIIKWFSYAIPFVYILVLNNVHYKWWILIALGLWLVWEVFYKVGRYYELWRLDNKWRIAWLCKICRMKL